MKMHQQNVFALSAIAAALLSAFSGAQAQESDLTALISPESEVRLGVGLVDRDNALSGQYNGLHDAGVYGLADLSLVRRDNSTGTWLRLEGRNLGLENRELRFDHEAQGNWRYGVEYSETIARDPFSVSTRLTGIGTGVQNPTGTATARNVDVEVQRKSVALAFDKEIVNGLNVQVRVRNEEKTGDRSYGIYSTNRYFLLEPIDFTTQQWETTLNYTQERWQLSGGYYGSSFHNQNSSLALASGVTGAATSSQGLPPDNSSHELYLSGAFKFTPTTQANFKASYGRAQQKDRFFAPPTLNTRSDLGGEVDTTLFQAGLTSRPFAKFNINASVRYEDRDDKTPQVRYLNPGTSVTRNAQNSTYSPKTMTSKLEAGYVLPMAFKLVGGLEYEERERSIPNATSVQYRRETQETTARVELRRSLGETLGGAVSYVYSDRSGDDYKPANSLTRLIDPIHWGDREREKWKLALDWTPLDSLSVQLALEDAKDKFPGGPLGRDDGSQRLYSVDASYALSEAWKLNGWFTQDDVRTKQKDIQGTTTSWVGDLRALGNSVGLGVEGAVTSKVSVGAELQHSRDRTEQHVSVLTGTLPGTLPDIMYERTLFKMFSTYALQSNAGLRLDLAHERWTTNDWTWQNASTQVYGTSDGTALSMAGVQKVTFVGLSGYYKWW